MPLFLLYCIFITMCAAASQNFPLGMKTVISYFITDLCILSPSTYFQCYELWQDSVLRWEITHLINTFCDEQQSVEYFEWKWRRRGGKVTETRVVGEGERRGRRRREGRGEPLTRTQIMIIMLAGSERLDTSIVYESPQSCAQFPLL